MKKYQACYYEKANGARPMIKEITAPTLGKAKVIALAKEESINGRLVTVMPK